MSISFYIPNRRGFFGYKSVESPSALISLVEKLEAFDLEKKALLQSLEQSDYFLALYQGEGGRGFEVSYVKEEESYKIRLLTPSAIGDWKGALLFMSHLAKKLKQEIRDEYGTVYTADSIFEMNFEADILYGLQHANDSQTVMHLFAGYAHDLYLSQTELEELLATEDPAEAFSARIVAMQNVPSYFSEPKYYRNPEGGYIGVYVLTEGVDQVIPTRPFPKAYMVEELAKNQASQDMTWELSLVVEDGSSPNGYKYLTSADLQAFLGRLPESRYAYLDASQIRIQPLSRPEIEKILTEIRQED